MKTEGRQTKGVFPEMVKTAVSELKERLRQLQPQRRADGVIYRGIFFCTIYYTPMESGFTTERGFDATPVSAIGLQGRKYPRDFLRAIKKEGFGRMAACWT